MSWFFGPLLPGAPALLPAAFRVVLSANIAAGGEATTARLDAPSGKTSGDFTTGRRWDDENGTDSLTIASDDWTTVAWAIAPNSAVVVDAEQYEFRVVADGAVLAAYTVTPQWTIGTPPTPNYDPRRLYLSKRPRPGRGPYSVGRFFKPHRGTTVVPALVQGIGVWDGASWATKPVKAWNGSAWVVGAAKTWNGSAWV